MSQGGTIGPESAPGSSVSAGVAKIIAGTGISVSPAGGTGNVTVAATGSGTGTVTSVGVIAANGFSGSVGTPTTVASISVSTTVTGLLKGNGTAVVAATNGTDYLAPGTSSTGTLVMNGNPITGVTQINPTVATVTVTSNAGTVAGHTSRINNFTNSSAATMAITISTSGAIDGDLTMVRIYDFSAAAQTIGWTNTENSTVSAPTTSNGSTTLPLTVGFQYNGSTSKWRCIASC
jgi:hypothetical protein